MKYCKQTLFSLISSILVIATFYLVSIFVINKKYDLSYILLDISIIVVVLSLNFLFGYFFAGKMLKYGFIIQFIVLLLLAILINYYENTFVFNLGIFLFLNSFLITLASGHTLVLYISSTSSFVGSSLFKCLISICSAILPSLSMFFGSRIVKK